jgi:hypothetical protein
MGAATSQPTSGQPKDPGVVTVHQGSVSSAVAGGASDVDAAANALLAHLTELRAALPHTPIPTSGPLADLAALRSGAVGATSTDSPAEGLSEPLTAAFLAYQGWRADAYSALLDNQEYLMRTMDGADARASKVVRHVQCQGTRLQQLSTALTDAAALPALLSSAAGEVAALQQMLAALEEAKCTMLSGVEKQQLLMQSQGVKPVSAGVPPP